MRDSYILYKENLHGEYKETFDKIELYILAQNIDVDSREERLGELLDIFISAQEDEKPVRKIVGNDLENFCKTFCFDLGVKSKLVDFLGSLKIFVIFELICSLFDLVPDPEENISFWARKVDSDIFLFASIMVFSLLVGYTANFLLCKLMFKYRKLKITLLKTLSVLSSCVCLAVSFVLVAKGEFPLLSCPVWLPPLMCILYLALYYTFKNKRRKERKAEKVSIADVASKEYTKDLDKIMQKKFDKLNKRNVRKGKGELNFSEFLKIQEDECIKAANMRWIYYLTPPALTTIIYFSSDYESLMDRIIFIIILLTAQYWGISLGLKLSKMQIEETQKWIEEKRNESNFK